MPASRDLGASASTGDELPTSRSLLQRARQRDRHAWEELVDLYAPLVYYWCRRAQLAEQDIPDVVQEVFRSVVTGIERFRKERPDDTFRGWLRTITRNKVIDHYRRREQAPRAAGGTDAKLKWDRLAEHTDDVDDEDEEGRHAERCVLDRALESIRPQFSATVWQAFWGVVVEGRSTNEVASELGVRPGTVRVAKCRVLQRLRQRLGDVE